MTLQYKQYTYIGGKYNIYMDSPRNSGSLYFLFQKLYK
jgi:hypothetical protein